MHCTFTRESYENTLFHDIDLYMSSCVKFDLYEGEQVLGTFIFGGSKGFAKFQSGKAYTLSEKSRLFEPSKFTLKDQDGNSFAEVIVKRPIFRGIQIQTFFQNHDVFYTVSRRNINKTFGSHNTGLHIYDGDRLVFGLNEWENRKWFDYTDAARKMSGVITIDDELGKDKIWGFLIAFQEYLWLSDIS